MQRKLKLVLSKMTSMRLYANCTFVPHCYTKPAKMVRVVIIGTLAYLYNNANLLTGLCACTRCYSESDINLSRRNVCQLSDNTEEDAVSGDV